MVNGIGAPGDPLPISNWDLGTIDGTGLLAPTDTMLQATTGTTPSGTNNVGVDPLVITPFDVGLSFTSWRTNVNFIGAILVTADLSPELMGDYHITSGSAAVNSGAASKAVPAYQQPPATLNAPTTDIDNQARPSGGGFDKGADETGGGPPVVAFPLTSLLDDFNRANGSLGANWAGTVSQANFRINSNSVQVRSSGGQVYWNASSFGANQEAFLTFTDLGAASTEQGLLLKFNGSSPTSANAAYISVIYSGGAITVRSRAPLQGIQTRGSVAVSFAVGDTLGARALSDGTVLIYKNGVQIGNLNVTSGANPWPTARAQAGGRIGAWFTGSFSGSGDARFDNFGGGTMP
jgi:hypothetical protein